MRSRILSITFFLTLYLGSTNCLGAAYYVKTTGNDALDGKSDATAWKTIAKVNAFKFSVGDDVYFKCGQTWAGQQLSIDWHGASDHSDDAVVGAYYVSGGSEIHGVNGTKPTIDGNHTAPLSEWLGLVQVTSNHVTVKNIRIINSEGSGLRFNEVLSCDADGVYTENTYKAGITLPCCNYNTAEESTISNCIVTDAVRRRVETGQVGDYALGTIHGQNITFRNNQVYRNHWEGLGIYATGAAFSDSGYCVIEKNVLWDNLKVGIYCANTKHNTIRWNIVYGTTDSTYHGGDNRAGPGIWVADECPSLHQSYTIGGEAENNIIYGNMVAFVSTGIMIGAGGCPEGDIRHFKDSVVANNTVVNCLTNLKINGANPTSGSYIVNNIFLDPGNDDTVASGATAIPGVVFSHNLWSSAVQGDLANNAIISSPMLAKTDGWDSLVGGAVNASVFALQKSSPAIDAGMAMSGDHGYLRYIADCDQSVSVWPLQITLMNQETEGSGWEIGTDIHAISISTIVRLQSPANFRSINKGVN